MQKKKDYIFVLSRQGKETNFNLIYQRKLGTSEIAIQMCFGVNDYIFVLSRQERKQTLI